MRTLILGFLFVAFMSYFSYVTYYENTDIMIIFFFFGIFLGIFFFKETRKDKYFIVIITVFILSGAVISAIYTPSSTNLYIVGNRTTLNTWVVRNIFAEPPAIPISKHFSNNDLFVTAKTKDGYPVSAFIDWQEEIIANESGYLALAKRYGPRTHNSHIKFMIDESIAEAFMSYAKTVALEEIITDTNQQAFIVNSQIKTIEAVVKLDIPFHGRSKIENLFF